MGRSKAAGIGLALFLGGCLNQADAAKMDAAQTQFFAQMKAKQYEAIYDAAAPEFKAATTEDTFVGFMQRIDRKLGDCQPPVKQVSWHANATTEGYFMSQGYSSACANGKLDQTLTLALRNGVVQVEGYNANSPLLLTD
jgi:outer membrane murein-binding lipoprotein Lpp